MSTRQERARQRADWHVRQAMEAASLAARELRAAEIASDDALEDLRGLWRTARRILERWSPGE